MKLLLVFMVSFSFMFSWGQKGVLKGNVILHGKSIEGLGDDILVELVGKKTPRIVWLGAEFNFPYLPADTFSVKISDGICIDTTLENVVVKANQTLELEINVLSKCKYDKSAGNKECPVCQQSDEVVPIVYGLLVSTPAHGRKKKAQDEQDFYPGGCELTCCDPNWHCRRDNIEF